MPEDVNLTGCGSEDPCHHLDRRRLARTVGTDDADERAAGDIEIDPTDRRHLTALTANPADFDTHVKHLA